MLESIIIARPYANAAFSFACENNDIKHWQQMLTVAAEISGNHQIKNLFTINVPSAVLANLFISICGDRLNNIGKDFIRIMAENKRLSLLPEVLKLFTHSANQDPIVDVTVISAKKLTEKQKAKITTAMEKRLLQPIKLINKIDKSTISGFIIQAGDIVIDSSIKGCLDRLTDALQS